MSHDPVNHPKHYTGHASGVECIQITEHMNFCLGNAVKYIWRAGEKGDAIEDLRKARWYLDREIARLASDGLQQDRRDGGVAAPAHQAAKGRAPAAEAGPPPQVAAAVVAPAAVPPTAKNKPGPKGGYRTPERLVVLRRDWPAGRPSYEILAAMNALPGKLIPGGNLLAAWAHQEKLKRPGAWVPSASIAAGQRAARAARAAALGDEWAAILKWAETVDPDMVLRGSPAERLAQINELRALEGLPAFVLRAPVAEAA
jgi:hypothetical protein